MKRHKLFRDMFIVCMIGVTAMIFMFGVGTNGIIVAGSDGFDQQIIISLLFVSIIMIVLIIIVVVVNKVIHNEHNDDDRDGD